MVLEIVGKNSKKATHLIQGKIRSILNSPPLRALRFRSLVRPRKDGEGFSRFARVETDAFFGLIQRNTADRRLRVILDFHLVGGASRPECFDKPAFIDDLLELVVIPDGKSVLIPEFQRAVKHIFLNRFQK